MPVSNKKYIALKERLRLSLINCESLRAQRRLLVAENKALAAERGGWILAIHRQITEAEQDKDLADSLNAENLRLLAEQDALRAKAEEYKVMANKHYLSYTERTTERDGLREEMDLLTRRLNADGKIIMEVEKATKGERGFYRV